MSGTRGTRRDRCRARRLPRRSRAPASAWECRGASLVEALTTLAILAILALAGAPSFVRWRQQQQVEGAVRHLELLFTRVCVAAVASGRTHAVQFDADGADLHWVAVVDGDGDGVTRADLAAHVDVPLEAWSSLAMLFPGVEGGRPPAVPTVLGGAADRGGLAFGRSEIVSCSPAGGARSGTLYLRSRGGDAAALRIYGPTGRITLWWWNGSVAGWDELR